MAVATLAQILSVWMDKPTWAFTWLWSYDYSKRQETEHKTWKKYRNLPTFYQSGRNRSLNIWYFIVCSTMTEQNQLNEKARESEEYLSFLLALSLLSLISPFPFPPFVTSDSVSASVFPNGFSRFYSQLAPQVLIFFFWFFHVFTVISWF